MGVSSSSANTRQYINDVSNIFNEFNESIMNSLGGNITTNIDQDQDFNQDVNINISNSDIKNVQLTQQITSNTSLQLQITLAGYAEGKSSSDVQSSFQSAVQDAIKNSEEAQGQLFGMAVGSSNVYEQYSKNAKYTNQTLLDYANEIYEQTNTNISMYQNMAQNISINIDNSKVDGIVIQQGIDISSDYQMIYLEQLGELIDSGVITSSDTDIQSSNQIEQTSKTTAGISSVVIIIIIIIVCLFMFGGIGGGSGKRNISGTASEVAIYDLKHSRNIFNIVMAILFVLDIIAIVITAVYYDKYNKQDKEYRQKINELNDQIYTLLQSDQGQNENINSLQNEVNKYQQYQQDNLDTLDGWLQGLIWSSVIGGGIMIIDIIGNVIYQHQINQWKDLIGDINTKQIEPLEQQPEQQPVTVTQEPQIEQQPDQQPDQQPITVTQESQ